MSTLAAAADDASFEVLVMRHMGIVRKIAATYCRTAEDRADLAQDILAATWRAWPGYDASRPFSTWLYRVALNVAISHHRRVAHRGCESLAEQHDDIAGSDDVDIEHRERQALVMRAMGALPAIDRALLLLHLEGHSHREVADVLGTSEGNVAVRLGRIKAHLRRLAGANQEA